MSKLRSALSGVYLKAHTAFYTSGGATSLFAALDDWRITGRITSAAARGVATGMVTGLVTGAAVAAVPNRRPPRAPSPRVVRDPSVHEQEVPPSPPTTSTAPPPSPTGP